MSVQQNAKPNGVLNVIGTVAQERLTQVYIRYKHLYNVINTRLPNSLP